MYRVILFCLLLPLLAAAEPPPVNPPQSPAEFHEQEAARWQRVFEWRELEALDESAADYDVTYYKLTLDLRDFAGQSITASTEIHAIALISAFRNVVLNFCDTLTIDSVRGSLGQVLSFTRGSQILTVTLERDYTTGENFSFTVYYRGSPCGDSETFDWWSRSVSNYTVPSIATLSEPYGARDWWPCKDDPHDKADSARIVLTVADTLTATSNGLLESVTVVSPSSHTFTWFEKYPIATYLICVSASNYTMFSDSYVAQDATVMPIDHYVYPETLSDALIDLDITPDAIEFFASIYGEYPFLEEKYGHSMFRWGGAMEHQCNTSYGYFLVDGTHYYDWILVHELGHQWWGDMVTLDTWPDIWLNEGFASYSEALWFEHLGGASALQSYMTSRLNVSDPSGPVYDPSVLFSSNTVYHKGAWVLHILRGAIRNDSLFFPGLREYRARHEYSSATTMEFLDAMSDVAGYDVTPYVYNYLYETNRPTYRHSYGTGSVDGVLTTGARLRQIQATPTSAFTNRVDLRFNGGQTVTQTVICDSKRQEYLFQMGYTPSSVTFDPSVWILKSATAEPLQTIILNPSLEVGMENIAYVDSLVAIGGNGNYSWSILSGTLPSGLNLSSDGVISGTPDGPSSTPLSIRVQDTNNQADTTNLVLTILAYPDAPDDLTIVAPGDGTVILQWSSVPNATLYDLERATLPDFSDAASIGVSSDTVRIDTAPAEDVSRFYRVTSLP
ncbi:M1 family metallopeptidase [bacterium]|nr:M1 family metallopeptidase [bacterium]